MSSFDSTHPRFLRPIDVARIRRNQNRIHVQRVLGIARNVALGVLLVLLAIWLYRHARSHARFAVKNIEVIGAIHTTRTDLDLVTARYAGSNLFKINIERLQTDLRTLPWISRIAVEKKLPDTLRIRVVEREPVALALTAKGLQYVDADGAAFAELSPRVGDPDLPLIREASGPELARTVELIRHLRANDTAVYSRISEIKPVAPDGFAIYDRELAASIYVNAADVSAKWRSLYGITRAENLQRGSIQYADLRFSDRVVIKRASAAAGDAQ
jgi:cell division protein FtsQ